MNATTGQSYCHLTSWRTDLYYSVLYDCSVYLSFLSCQESSNPGSELSSHLRPDRARIPRPNGRVKPHVSNVRLLVQIGVYRTYVLIVAGGEDNTRGLGYVCCIMQRTIAGTKSHKKQKLLIIMPITHATPTVLLQSCLLHCAGQLYRPSPVVFSPPLSSPLSSLRCLPSRSAAFS